jgi:hypothetical protein
VLEIAFSNAISNATTSITCGVQNGVLVGVLVWGLVGSHRLVAAVDVRFDGGLVAAIGERRDCVGCRWRRRRDGGRVG